MTENKLKNMMVNGELDNLIYNEKEKLCKLKTSEEVLEALNKCNYHKTKDAFERELLEILQEITLTEEELNNVSGGKISHRQEIAKFLGVVSLAGAINMPTTMAEKKPVIAVDDTSVSAVDAAPVIAVEKEPVSAVDAASVIAVEKKKTKNSGRLSHTKENKFAKISTGIVGAIGLGALFFYGGKKLLGSSNTDRIQKVGDTTTGPKTHNDQTELANTIESLVKKPSRLSTVNIDNIHKKDLEDYAIREFESWSQIMSKSYDKNSGKFKDPKAWNANFDTLLKIRWAIWLLSVKLGLLTPNELETFTKGRYIATLKTLNEDVKQELCTQVILIPGASQRLTLMLGRFWRDIVNGPCIDLVCESLLEIPLILDQMEKKSLTPVTAITALSKEYFGTHTSPQDTWWTTASSNGNANLNEIIQNTAGQNNDKNKNKNSESSTLDELANLKAPNEQWKENLEDVDRIVVSLIQEPVQEDYTELVTDISSDDLVSYATEGLKLWCTNTKDYYDKNTRSITDANAWNKNFGLLVKARWAVWLLLIKENKVVDELLKKNVELRRFDKGNFLGDSLNLAWYEYYDGDEYLTNLTNPIEQAQTLLPGAILETGNVDFAVWSLTDDLPDNEPERIYTKLRKALLKIAEEELTDSKEFIGEDFDFGFDDLF